MSTYLQAILINVGKQPTATVAITTEAASTDNLLFAVPPEISACTQLQLRAPTYLLSQDGERDPNSN